MKLHRITEGKGYTTFGCMWKKGECKSDSVFRCLGQDGKEKPVQSRVTAWWPDGSVKWTAHTVNTDLCGDEVTVEITETENQSVRGIQLNETHDGFDVDNGCYVVHISKKGGYLFDTVTKAGEITAKNCEPELILREPCIHEGFMGSIDVPYSGRIDSVTVEEQGELQCIFRFLGTHVNKRGETRFPFIIRMKVQYKEEVLGFTHTFMVDADENRDFLKGLGVRFEKLLKGPMYNRHIKITGDRGVLHESVVTLVSWHPRVPEGLYEAQMSGKVLNPVGDDKVAIDKIMEAVPFWGTYDFCQDSASHFGIRKKLTGDDLCYIDVQSGYRSRGSVAFGSEAGSVAIGIKDFWEKYPSGVTVSGLDSEEAEAHIWLWSPDAEPMDFRHYARRGYNEVCYEGYNYKGADPDGIACTNEFVMQFFNEMIIDDTELLAYNDKVNDSPIYVGDPEAYHELRAFGYWSQVSEETETERWLEEQLEKAFEFYKNEVEQRNWYGMFNYGDFMHTYDPVRHNWRYDVGGYAWDNTELVPTLWLWLYFMRTGRADVFRLAEKLTRHTSEVDVYHLGKYKGMGSRHNVRHWGCPCKEARIAMAGHHRYYYYLTGDRRLEDIFDELKDNELTFLNRDPLGDFFDKKEMVYPSHARSGPDWSSLCSNWMTEWERTNNSEYLRKIEIGTADILAAPLQLSSGPDFEFDPNSLHLRYIGERTTGGCHLQICMGAPSIWMEMAELMDSEDWRKMLTNHGRFYFLSREQQFKESNGIIGKRESTFPMMNAAMGAYAAERLGDKELAKNVWRILLASLLKENDESGFTTVSLENTANLAELKEIPWISTNFVAQFCLNVVMALDFIRPQLPKTLAEAKALVSEIPTDSIFRRA